MQKVKKIFKQVKNLPVWGVEYRVQFERGGLPVQKFLRFFQIILEVAKILRVWSLHFHQKQKGARTMNLQKAKIFHDGSHFIAIPKGAYPTGKGCKRHVTPKRTNSKANRLLLNIKGQFFANMPKNTALKFTTNISTTVFQVRHFNAPECNDF